MGRGVKVQLLLDQQEYHAVSTDMNNARFDEELAALGAAVRYKSYGTKWTIGLAHQLHCKYMIVDDKTVLTGSLNWTANSELKTIENLLLIDRAKIADAYRKRFAVQWIYGKGEYKGLIERLSNLNTEAPVSFPPISLTGKQVRRILEFRPSVSK